MDNRPCFLSRFVLVIGVLAWTQSTPAGAQDTNALLQSLLSEMRDLKAAVDDMRGQLAESHRETEQLRRDLEAARQPATIAPSGNLADLTEQQQLLSGQLADQYQSKVESSSKYRVRLSGMALINLSATRGSVNDIDVPESAQARAAGDSRGSVGATVRQSTIGLEVFGPEVAGAKTSGEVQFDFFGGFPATGNNAVQGIMRLRTAKIRLDWDKTSLVAGQDSLFFSPLNPTSLASTAYAPLGSAGNLWTWTPQVYVERRTPLGNQFRLVMQGGILDPFAGETSNEYSRSPGPGERSGVPAVAARTALKRTFEGRTLQIGAGGYYARQNWGPGQNVDAWAATLDWEVPLGRRIQLSGEAYRGRAIAGLDGAPGGSVVAVPAPAAGFQFRPLDAAGGWAQLKFRTTDRLEFNGAFGEGYAFRPGLNRSLFGRPIDGLAEDRNSSAFLNAIYTVRSNLVLSAEYRRLWTSGFNLPVHYAGHITLSGAIFF